MCLMHTGMHAYSIPYISKVFLVGTLKREEEREGGLSHIPDQIFWQKLWLQLVNVQTCMFSLFSLQVQHNRVSVKSSILLSISLETYTYAHACICLPKSLLIHQMLYSPAAAHFTLSTLQLAIASQLQLASQPATTCLFALNLASSQLPNCLPILNYIIDLAVLLLHL